jgi:hypothetical protein
MDGAMLKQPCRWIAAAMLFTLALACTEFNTNPNAVIAVSLDPPMMPAVVAGDTLRDTNGVAQRLRGTAYNFHGDTLMYRVKYLAIDGGVVVDTFGFVIGDTARPSAIRLLADAGGLQTQPVRLFVVPKPTRVAVTDSVDTLVASPRDTTVALMLQVLHDSVTTAGPVADPVQGYIVSFAIQQPISGPPLDTVQAQLVNANGQRGWVDTTAIDGTATQRIRVLPGAVDSVIVLATVKYKGANVAGSPARFALRVRGGP